MSRFTPELTRSFQAYGKLGPSYIQASVLMNNISDAPITGHTLGRFGVAQKTNCKNSSMPGLTLGRVHLSRDMRAPDAHISRAKDARAKTYPGTHIIGMFHLGVYRCFDHILIVIF